MNRRRLLQVLSLLPAVSVFPSFALADAGKSDKAGGQKGAGKGNSKVPANLQSETEGLGQAMQYKHDASKVKHPMYKKGSTCFNCVQYNMCGADKTCKPLSADALKKADYAPCAIFPGKVVAKNGWCMSWGPKA